MKPPTSKQIAAVLEFLPVLKRAGFNVGTQHGWRQSENGIISLPWVDYSDEITRLMSVLYENGFVGDFDWMSWQNTANMLVENQSLLDRADLETLQKLLMTHLRQEHFGDGHFASMIECGHIAAILERLAELQRQASQVIKQSEKKLNDMKKSSEPLSMGKDKKNALLVGNMGLYAVCYELSKRGWNVMPTSRNARGIDILGYNQSGNRTITVQVKALSKVMPVPLGTDPSCPNLIAEFIIIAGEIKKTEPKFFIAKTSDVMAKTPDGAFKLIFVGDKDGKKSCWLWAKNYQQFEDKWETIGEGW